MSIDVESVMHDLSLFGTKGHERLVVQDDVLKTRNHGNWFHRLIQFFYKSPDESIHRIAKVAMQFFEENSERITDLGVLYQFVPVLRKANCGYKLEELIATMNQMETEMFESTQSEQISQLSTISVEESLVTSHSSETELMQKKLLFSNIFEEALVTAREIENDYSRNQTLAIISSELVKFDPAEAIQVYREIDNDSRSDNESLVQLAVKLVPFDLSTAFEIARGLEIEKFGVISGRYHKAKALIGIAKAQAKSDPDQFVETIREAVDVAKGENHLRESLFLKIARTHVEIDPMGALETIQLFGNGESRSESLSAIAKELAKVDPVIAIQTAIRIQDPFWKALAFKDIADVQRHDNRVGALPTIRQAIDASRQMAGNMDYPRALVRAGVVQARMDPYAGLETIKEGIGLARRIELKWDRARVFTDLAPVLAKVDPEGALQIAQETPTWQNDSRFRDEAVAGVIAKKAKINITEALLDAREQDSALCRTLALTAIADKQIKENDPEAIETLREAVESAEEIERSSREAHLKVIIIKLASLEPLEALELTTKFENSGFYAEVLDAVLIEIAKIDIEKALEEARGIQSPKKRAIALAKIAAAASENE